MYLSVEHSHIHVQKHRTHEQVCMSIIILFYDFWKVLEEIERLVFEIVATNLLSYRDFIDERSNSDMLSAESLIGFVTFIACQFFIQNSVSYKYVR